MIRKLFTRMIDKTNWHLTSKAFLLELPSMLNFPRHFSSSNYAWNMAHFSKYERRPKKSFNFCICSYRLNEKAQQFEICTYTFKVFCLLRLEFEWVINDFYSHTSFQMKWKTITLVFQKNNIEIGALNGWGFLLSTKNGRVVPIFKN